MKKIYIKVIILLLVPLLVACTPSASQIQTAVAQTQAALPTPTPIPTETPIPTPTPIPLSELNLEDILIKPGDLPAGFSGGQIKDVLPGMFDKLNVPKADQFIFQQLLRNGDLTGGVVLLLFTSLDDVEKAYEEISGSLGKDQEQVPDVGDKASDYVMSGSIAGVKYHAAGLVFARCHAVASIWGTSELLDKTSLSVYARRLIKRLDPLVCR